MSGRSASSVRELLGKFEENSQHVSPPSRGRSPAGSESNGSRPLSKVRTSFVSVERSGQMAPSLRKLSNNFEGDLGRDGQVDSETSVDHADSDKPLANGNGTLHPQAKDTAGFLGKVKEEDAASGIRKSMVTNTGVPEMSRRSNTAAVDSDKPASAATDDSATLFAVDPKDEKVVSEGGALLQRRTSLGDLLKGHPFEREAGTIPETTQLEAPKVHESTSSSALLSSPKLSPTDLKVNGGQHIQTSTISVAAAKPPSTCPSASSIKDTPAASSAPTAASAANTSTSPQSPKTPQDVSTSSRQLPSNTSLPKQTVATKSTSKSIDNQSKQGSGPRSSRPPAVSKPPTAASTTSSHALAPTHTSSNMKSGPASPPTKAYPKSPTRPVRLPASLTAPTAASVAKLGGVTSSRSTSGTTTITTSKPSAPNKHRAPAITPQTRLKASRTSLPASSVAPSKPKARTSIVGSKPADGGFLARMMRPTQSSAGKTHEKVEPKTPPKKAAASQPRKVSEGASEHVLPESVEGDLETLEAAEEPHVPKLDITPEGTNVDVNAVSGAVSEALGTQGEERGMNGNGAAPSEAAST